MQKKSPLDQLSSKGKIGLNLAVLGLVIQIVGYILIKIVDLSPGKEDVYHVITLGVSMPCIFFGLILLAVSKGRSGVWWAFLGFWPIFGPLLAVFCLLTTDKKVEQSSLESRVREQGLERWQMIKLVFFFTVFIVGSLIISFKKGAFAASVLTCFPAMVYFVAKGIQFIKKPLAVVICIVGFFGVWVPVMMDTSRMGDLAKQREAAVREIRPIIMEYREDHGRFPEKLEDLVPDYISEIPPTLIYNEQEEYYHRVKYYASGAYFRFYNFRGPDSGVTYDIKKDEFEYDT